MSAGAGAATSALAVRLASLEPDFRARSYRAGQTDALLGRLCRVVRDVLGVSRATVLVYDEPASLVPAVSVAREDHDEMWQRFRSMRPITLMVDANAATVLSSEGVIVIPDAASSPLVPEDWREAFTLTSLAVAPLHVDGRKWGALVVDDMERRHEFSAHDVRTLSDLANLATTAIAATERAVVAEAETALRTALRESVARMSATNDLAEAVDAVAPFLLDATGFELLGAALREGRVARALNVATTNGYDADALRQLRTGANEAVSSDGRLVVPMRGWRGLLGILVLRSHGDRPKRLDLVHEVADRFAVVAEQVSADERAASAAVTADAAAARLGLAREAIGHTLRTFRGVGYATARSGPALFSVASSNHARRAIDDLDEVRQVLVAQSSAPTLVGAFRALLEAGAGSQYELQWSTNGTPRPVASDAEIACLRTAARFIGLVRETRGRILAARLSFTRVGVECLLSSNGLLRDPATGAGESGAHDLIGPWIRQAGGHAELETGDAAFSVRFTLPYVAVDRRPSAPRARVR